MKQRTPLTYYEHVERAFDQSAPRYDTRFFRYSTDVWMRRVSLAVLLDTFKEGDRVLEIGCGTGVETLRLARAGISVLATDISEEMLSILRRKAEHHGLEERVQTRRMAAHEVERMVQEGPLDGAFSSFGALNCEPRLQTLPAALHRLLLPKANFICSVVNKLCLTEILFYLAKGDPERGVARARSPTYVRASRNGEKIPTFAYSVGEFMEIFRPFFEPNLTMGLAVVLPPPHLQWIPRKFGVQSRAEALESKIGGAFPFNRLGDHFLVRMRRKA